jgi:hypothetical protein
MDAIMEEARRIRHTPLTVQRAFAGSRLEEQILSRVYERVVPILRKSTRGSQTPRATEQAAEHQCESGKTSKGA